MNSLWEHQKKGVELALQKGSFGFLFDVGTGKTKTTIYTCRQLYNKYGSVLTTLIICPLIVKENWKNEWVKNSNLKPEQILVLTGSGEKKIRQLYSMRGPSVIITNYESLLNEKLYKAIGQLSPEILIVDESQRCKNPTSKRTKFVHMFAKKMRHRFILSGTPVLKNEMDIWAQAFIIDQGKSFGDNFFKFKLKYFIDKNAGMPKQSYFPNWVIRKERKEELQSLLANMTLSVKKEDCLDLPPFTRQTVHVELEKEQKKHYLQMKELFITYIQDKACVATLAITKGLRLQQIISGHMPMDDGSIITFEKTSREIALQELLEDLCPYHKVIVWAVFREDYRIIKRVCNTLSLPFVELHGEVPNKEKFENMDKFNTDESIRVLIGHPQSGGIGVNLIAASYSIYYSRNFSLENDLQSEARNYRAGSEIHKSITRIDIVAKDTLDEAVLSSLQNKKDIGAEVLRAWVLEK